MRMSCGACGYHLFQIFENGKNLLVKCDDCSSVSEISVNEPKLRIDWPIGIPSQGVLCVMPGETEKV